MARRQSSSKSSNAAPAGKSGASDAPPSQRPRKRRSWPYVVILVAAWSVIFGAIFFSRFLSDLPDVNSLLVNGPSRDITILDDRGRMIAQRGLTQGVLVEVSKLPAFVPDAFIAIEDRRFREHFGLDPIGLVRAAYENMMVGHVVQGGSTLTQQLAKNLFLEPKRTFDRKMQEAMLALYLESRYSKDQILTLYLNRVYFGAGVYGIEAAAERFFGKHAQNLTLPEAAMLAGSVKAPARYNPLADPDASQAARPDRAARHGGCGLHRRPGAPGRPSHARAHRARHGDAGLGLFRRLGDLADSRLYRRGQASADRRYQFRSGRPGRSRARRVAGLAKEGSKLGASQAALVAMTPDGAVRAMVGGQSYEQSPYNRATDAQRQPGSAFKPFVYLAAFEHGHKPDDIMNDGPVDIHGWKPSDFEGEYLGDISL